MVEKGGAIVEKANILKLICLLFLVLLIVGAIYISLSNPQSSYSSKVTAESYQSALRQNAETISSAVQELEKMKNNFEESDEFKAKAAEQLGIINRALIDAKAIVAPDELNDVHNLYMEGISGMEDFLANLIKGAAARDMDRLQQAAEDLQEAKNNMNKALEDLERYNNKVGKTANLQ